MCGIVGYVGNDNCIPILTEGLRMLEYRGYDSAGVAFFEKGEVKTVKACGKLACLEERLVQSGEISASCGMGHTRWATHGAPSDINSHPHSSELVSIIHNGIIENHKEIEEMLASLGYTFVSATDTERACKLIDHIYKQCKDPIATLFEAARQIKGSYAFGVMYHDLPNVIYVIRKDSPLILAQSDSGCFLASDIPAVLPYSREYCRLEEGIVAELKVGGITFYNSSLAKTEQKFEVANWNEDEARKGGYAHFMIKEIHEQPEAIKKTVSLRIKDDLPCFEDDKFPSDELLSKVGRIHVVACGTAMHAGLVGKYLIEKLARIPVDVEIASEFRYGDPILTPDSLVVLLSQSGETADTLAGLRHAKKLGIPTLAIVNVFGSSIAQEADYVLYTKAGPEIAVASTKAYTVQCATMYLFGLYLGYINKKIAEDEVRHICSSMKNQLPELIEETLKLGDKVKSIAQGLTKTEHLFYIGRGIDYHLAVEASLKLKEISYIHSEAYASGELKHGTISLITNGIPVVCIMTDAKLAKKTASGIHEVRSRGARVILICTEETAVECPEIPEKDRIVLPSSDAILCPYLTATAVQLLAYHVSNEKGLDVDKPRNLAKSVTVE